MPVNFPKSSPAGEEQHPEAVPLPQSTNSSPPHRLLEGAECVMGQDGYAYALIQINGGRRIALRSGSKPFTHFVREQAKTKNEALPKRNEMQEIDHIVRSEAEASGKRMNVWLRVAPVDAGVEIDIGDDTHHRVRITSDGVEVVDDSPSLFFRSAHLKSLVRPDAIGELELLDPFLPKLKAMRELLLAYITYTIARAKADHSKYVILVLTGGQGTGKTALAKLLQRLIDPNVVHVQVLPNGVKDIAIATQNAHVVFYDNIRTFTPQIADGLCVASTGGSLAARQLYTDADQQVVHLHGAVVLNGLHSFIDQPDLAQRCLHLRLPSIVESSRRSEHEMEAQLAAALPRILRGLYDLIAKILRELPTATVTAPHRMIDFVRWLAAMEKVTGSSHLQDLFLHTQAAGQREALEEQLLSAAVLKFAEALKDVWSGTPSDLLVALQGTVPQSQHRSRDWPANAIALSRRLTPLQAALRDQGIDLQFARGKERTITITPGGLF